MTNRASVFDMHAATYTVDIVVRFTGNGGYSYLFPGGTDVAAVSGWHEIDKNLNISIAPLTVTPPKPIVTLPYDGKFEGLGPKRTANSSAADNDAALARARSQNDLNALQQAIQGLRISQ